jgi:hypothetical protein
MKEDRKFLDYLPRWLRSIPNLGAFIVGWITIMGWLAWIFGGRVSYFQGEGGAMLFVLILLPLMRLGFSAQEMIAKATGLDLSSYPAAAQSLAIFLTIALNTLAAWLVLKILAELLGLIRRNVR